MDFWCNLLKGALLFKDRKSWTRSNSNSFEDGSETVEVKMPIATSRKASVSLQQRQKSSGQPIPPQQFITKKLPQSEVTSVHQSQRNSRRFRRREFLAGTRSESGHGPLEDEHLRVNSGKEISCTGAPGAARRRLGQVRNQTVGPRARARVPIGCLVWLGDLLRLRSAGTAK